MENQDNNRYEIINDIFIGDKKEKVIIISKEIEEAFGMDRFNTNVKE